MIVKPQTLAFLMNEGIVDAETLESFDINQNEDASLDIRPKGKSLKAKDVIASLPEAPSEITISVKAGLRGIEEGLLNQKKLQKLFASSFTSKKAGGAELANYKSAKAEDPIAKAQRLAKEAKAKAASGTTGADFPE